MQTQTKVVRSCVGQHGHSRSTHGILELRVDLGDHLAHLLELGEHVLLGRAAAEHGRHLGSA